MDAPPLPIGASLPPLPKLGPKCKPVTIDFSGLASGDAFPPSYYAALNVTVVGTPKNKRRCGGAHVIDTANPTAGCNPAIGEPGDSDLYSPTLGNALVLKNTSVASCLIDDCGRGGNITFEFSNKINVKHVKMIDLDEPATIYVLYADGSKETVGVATGPEGAVVKFPVNRNNVAKLIVSLKRSGGIGEVFWKKCGDVPGGSGDPHFKTWSGKFRLFRCDWRLTLAG